MKTGTVSVVCKLAVGECDVESGQYRGTFSTQLIFLYNQERLEKQIIPLDLPAQKSNLVVMGVSLRYQISKDGDLRWNKDKAYQPAGIVDAILL